VRRSKSGNVHYLSKIVGSFALEMMKIKRWTFSTAARCLLIGRQYRVRLTITVTLVILLGPVFTRASAAQNQKQQGEKQQDKKDTGQSAKWQGTTGSLTTVQADNAESTSKPDDSQVPEANPARPTITNPAHIPPVGYLQFEQGFLQAIRSPGGPAHQFSLNQATRLSVHPRLMLEFPTQPFAASHFEADANSGTPASDSRDAGDLQFGVQGLLIKEVALIPTVAVGYIRRVRAGSSPDIDIGSFSQSALVLISGDVGRFHYDSNFIVSEQNSDSVRRAQYGQSVSVTGDIFAERLHDKLEITGEIWHFTQPLVFTTDSGLPSERSNAVGMLWALGYSARSNIVFDAGFERGLTSSSTQWQAFGGLTYLLPHRLWPHREGEHLAVHHGHIHRR
jgi:hypothetical protein